MFNLAYAQICQQEKVDEAVDFPINGLDVSKYIKIDHKAEGTSTIYDLYGVVNHFGSLNGGHYTATCKNSIDDNWYYFNDSSVSGTSGSKVMADAAYVLFYRRRELATKNKTKKGSAKADNDSTKATSNSNNDSQNEETQDDVPPSMNGSNNTVDKEEEK